MTSFIKKELTEIKAFFGSVDAEAIMLLKASLSAVVADIEAHGIDAVKATFAAMATAAATAKAAGKSNSEAGQAALAVVGAAVVAGAVTEAKVAEQAAVSADTAHALATSVITGTAGA